MGGKQAKKILGRTIRLVGCAGVGIVGIAIDVPAMCGIAVAKSPVLLWKGWKHHVVSMEACVEEGSFARPICLPVTGAMLLLWPVRVVGSIASAVIYSFGKGVYGGVVAYQEKSIRCGFKHVIAAIAEYDEFTNDAANLREGSCLPRPVYHKHHRDEDEEKNQQQQNGSQVSVQVIQEFKLERLLRYLRSNQGRIEGRRLIEEGLLLNKACSKAWEMSVALTILCSLLHGDEQQEEEGSCGGSVAAAAAAEVVLYDPLEMLERQIRDAGLEDGEKRYLSDKVLQKKSDLKEELEIDPIRKATLEAFGRRIRGISAFVSRNLEFRAQFLEFLQFVFVASQDMISFDD